MSISRRNGKPIAEQPYTTALFRNKNGATSTRDNMGDSQIQHAERERPKKGAGLTRFHLQKNLGKTKWICSERCTPEQRWVTWRTETWGWRWGWGLPAKGQAGPCRGEWHVLYLDRSSCYTGVHMCHDSLTCMHKVVTRMKITHQ